MEDRESHLLDSHDRFNKIEDIVYGLHSENSQIKTEMSSLTRAVTNLTTKVDAIISQKTDWKLVLGGVSLFLMIGGLALAPIYKSLDYHSDSIIKMQDALLEKASAIEDAYLTSHNNKDSIDKLIDARIEAAREMGRVEALLESKE